MSIDNTLFNGSKGVLYCSARGNSGYAESGKRMVYELIRSSIPISWYQFTPDDTKNDDDDIIYQSAKTVLNKDIEFDTVVFHCTPECWINHIDKFKIKFINKKLIGYTTWETNKIPDEWVQYMNLMDEIWVPCKLNKEVFEKCGVDAPIIVVPYPFIRESLPEVNVESITRLLSKSKWYGNKDNKFTYGLDWKVFYSIGEWSDRKNVEDTVKTFCESFTNKDHVKLIIKTHHLDYSKVNIKYCIDKFESVIKQFKNHPEILLITESLTKQEILFLHSIGDCYFTMTRGEGFCIDAFDAFNYGKSVVIPSFGGQVDYLGNDYKGLIDYNLTNVDFKERNSIYKDIQQWAEPVIEEGSNKIKECYKSTKPCDISLIIENVKCEPIDLQVVSKRTSGGVNGVKIEIRPTSEFSGITYIGQYGTCGYATAAKGNLCHFFTKGIPITWTPLYFDNSQLSDECFYNAMVKSLIKKPIEFYDTVIVHATPDIWPELIKHKDVSTKNKKLIGYTVWESSMLPKDWVININKCVDEVWCPSIYNKEVFKNSGVNIPIKVFPHIFLQKELPDREFVSLKSYDEKVFIKDDGYYTFYNISELNPRKGVEDLIRVFCDVFTDDDKVRLIIKVHYRNYEDVNKKYCINKLDGIVSEYKHPPKIHYILGNLTEKELLGLHSIGDCYVSLCKSEGFGLTIFEAHKYGKKVITTGYGGQIDFLGKDYDGLVKYTIDNVKGMKEFSKYYSEDQMWAYPDLDHAGKLMRKCIKNDKM